MKTTVIRIREDKNGKQVAHYWGRAYRWLPLTLAIAKQALVTGEIFGGRAVEAEKEL
jgi:hypothetical protein